MSTPIVRFNTKDRPEFVKELRTKTYAYFKENNISQHANANMKIKTVFMLILYLAPFITMLFYPFTSTLLFYSLWAIMGVGMAGIGLSVMHDANHGAYSTKKYVNQSLGYLANLLGVSHVNWKIQHNVLHHSFTNIDAHDADIENPFMRFSPTQESKKGQRFQAYYAPFLYSLMTLYWYIAKDFDRLKRYKNDDLIKTQGLTYGKALTEIILNKIWYTILMFGAPIFLTPFAWWQVIIGFLIMQLLCGLILALIFQPAHVLEETQFFEIDENNSVENNWAIHQMTTTANFANKSTWFSWFIGGLNFQIEHHLFPNICHVHYSKISKIVKETAEEYGIPYHHHTTFYDALRSHFSLINALGTGKYDEQLKTQ